MISDSVTTTKSGVPYLSRIPGLGALFRNSVDQATRTELIILVTPRVVSSQAEARRVTRELRQRLRGLDAFETQDSGQSTHPVR